MLCYVQCKKGWWFHKHKQWQNQFLDPLFCWIKIWQDQKKFEWISKEGIASLMYVLSIPRSIPILCLFFSVCNQTRSVEDQVSISPTFYPRLFRTKVSRVAFLYFHFRFELILAQKYLRKCAHKMLVKLTTVTEIESTVLPGCPRKAKHGKIQFILLNLLIR